MTVLAALWHYGPPAVVVSAGTAALATAIRSRPGDLRLSWSQWPWLLPVLIATGDAAVGVGRPAFERAWKGATAGLLWVALAIALWRQARARPRKATPPPGSGGGAPAETAPPGE